MKINDNFSVKTFYIHENEFNIITTHNFSTITRNVYENFSLTNY